MAKENNTKADPRVKDIHGFYSAVFNKLFGFNPSLRYPITGSMLKKLLVDFTQWQIQVMILIHFNWRGMEGNDEWAFKKLRDRSFPLEWLHFSVNSYQAYARNVLGLNFDDDKSLQEYVHNYVKSI